ncbi:ribonuclease III [Petroclostridium sp. X23]|uniref:ribonuclease III n=1 Tax=Petroclostridium sp. X23 TaxID=3045146 RepID=UPI0024AE5979|nr:ribonuclease III [Petroclostridium sp. X23]WHH59415.1 ribonuclease III [Petroclostridium sp. X23]
MKTDKQLKQNLEIFQNQIKYKFRKINHLIVALTHSSYANENRHSNILSNERLEFLGDAVLNIIVSDYIYRQYSELPEGELTRIRASVVCEPSLAQCAKNLEIGKFLFLGKGEEMTGGRERISILSDAFEAIIASIFLDRDLETAKRWVLDQLSATIEAAVEGTVFKDYKTILQELLQKNSEERVEYEIVAESGPDHNKEFHVDAKQNNKVIGTGKGKSKKEAEQNAAKYALEQLQSNL